MNIFKLIKLFQKAKGRSPSPGELADLKKQAEAMQPSNVLPFQYKRSFGDEVDELIKKGDVTIGTAPKTTKKKAPVDPKFESAVKAQDERKESFSAFKKRMEARNKEAAFNIAFKRYKDIDKKPLEMDEVISIYTNLNKYPKGKSIIFGDITEIERGHMLPNIGNRKREMIVNKLNKMIVSKKQPNPFEEVKVSDQLEMNFDDFDPKGMAGGGLAYMLGEGDVSRTPAKIGGLMKMLQALSAKSPLQRYKDYLASVKRRSQEGDFKSLAPELGAITGGGILVNRALTRKLNEISKQEREAFYANIEKEYREKYKDDPEMLEIMLRGLEKRKSEKSAKGFYQDGGRVRFDKGGMSRRGFLKLMGGLASIPILGKYFKLAKPAAKVMTAIEKSNAAGMPKWFPSLVNKVMKEGKDVTKDYSTIERSVVKQAELPNSKTKILVEQDINTGNTTVDVGLGKHGWPDGWNGQPVRLHLKKGEWIEPQVSKTGKVKKKAVKTKDEFDVEEAEFTGDAESVKYEESSFNKFGEHGSDFSEIEKYATGKVTKKSKPKKFMREPDYAKGGLAGVLKL